MSIWERYFIRQTLSIFFLILGSFYALYMLIDYASHSDGRHYHHAHFQWAEFFGHYYGQFVQRLDVFLPFALLIATIRTLCQLSANNELVALAASGITLKRLLRPFIVLGIFGTLILYVNTEYLLPHSLAEMRHRYDTHQLLKSKKNHKLFVQHVALKDNSTLLFQNYDTATGQFFNAYWIKSPDEIYRMKFFKIPTGTFVDHLVRNEKGQFEQKSSFETKSFPEMRFNKKVLFETVTPSEELSLSKLWKTMPDSFGIPNEKEAEIATTFYQKLAMPWLCLLVVMGPAPFCVRFARHLPTFFIYAFSLFGFVAFYLMLDAALVLGSRQVVAPGVAISVPFFLFSGTCLVKFLMLK